MFQDIEDLILTKTKGDLNKIAEITSHLVSLDWNAVIQSRLDDFTRKTLDAHQKWNAGIQNGGGICDECNEFFDGSHYKKLYVWPHVNAHTPEEAAGNRKRTYTNPLMEKVDFVNTEHNYQALLHIRSEQNRPRYCWKCFSCAQNKLLEYEREHNFNPVEFAPCETCKRLVPEHAGYQKRGIHGYIVTFCCHCYPAEVERQFTICTLCKKRVVGPSYSKDHICENCRKHAHWNIVSNHRSRAKAAGTQATLTPQEWTTTLAFFVGKCAYCRVRPYQALEHFVPISLGGGTTVNNCIPACQRCNAKKNNTHPEMLDRFFQPEIIDSIRGYLAGDHKENMYPPTGQELVIWRAQAAI